MTKAVSGSERTRSNGHEAQPSAPGEVCPNCGWARPLLWVHGHGQCPRCGTVIAPCCEGAPLADVKPKAAAPPARKRTPR
jgi:hypothetical protein